MAIVLKPLEWEFSEAIDRGGGFWKAETVIGTYYVAAGDWWIVPREYDTDLVKPFKDNETAKQVCFVDYESNVLSAIEGEIKHSDPLHGRLVSLANTMKGEFPPDVIADVLRAARISMAFDSLVSRGCDHCADIVRVARSLAE